MTQMTLINMRNALLQSVSNTSDGVSYAESALAKAIKAKKAAEDALKLFDSSFDNEFFQKLPE